MATNDKPATQPTEAYTPEPSPPANAVSGEPASGAESLKESVVLGNRNLYERLVVLAEQTASLSEPAHNEFWEFYQAVRVSWE